MSDNVLVGMDGICKLTGFQALREMSQSFNEEANEYEYVSKDDETSIRHAAPEILTDGHYSEKSMVFGCGYLLYEVHTYGVTPYNWLKNDETEKIRSHVITGGRPPEEECIPQPISDLMKDCHHHEPNERPNLVTLKTRLMAAHKALEQSADADRLTADYPPLSPQDLQHTQMSSCIALDDLEHSKNLGFFGFPTLAEDIAVLQNIRGTPQIRERVEKTKEEDLNKLKDLNNENIVKVLSISLYSGKEMALVTENSERGNLLSLVLAKECSSMDLVRSLTQILSGLVYMHDSNLLHCDIRAEHMMVFYDHSQGIKIKISRLGRSTYLRASPMDYLMPKDTFRRSAPEVIKNNTYSCSSDVYSFGMMCYELYKAQGEDKGCQPMDVEPLGAIKENEILAYLEGNNRPPKPSCMPTWLYIAVKQCLLHKPEERPPFILLHDCFTYRKPFDSCLLSRWKEFHPDVITLEKIDVKVEQPSMPLRDHVTPPEMHMSFDDLIQLSPVAVFMEHSYKYAAGNQELYEDIYEVPQFDGIVTVQNFGQSQVEAIYDDVEGCQPPPEAPQPRPRTRVSRPRSSESGSTKPAEQNYDYYDYYYYYYYYRKNAFYNSGFLRKSPNFRKVLPLFDFVARSVAKARFARRSGIGKRGRSTCDKSKKCAATLHRTHDKQGDDVDAIRTWSDELEDRMLSFENAVINIEQTIINIKATESELAKQVEEETAKQLRDRRREEELKFEQVKLEQRLKYEKQLKPEASGSQPKERINAKLPKLVITKFKGTTSDWLRFWNQFEAEIDQTEVNQITKFSYLKELLEPKIRGLVDGLPFNSEGYERAKNILKTRFGKTSEIINAYVTELMSLPVIHGSNAGKIYEFYEKLLANVQALETLGKLGDVKGYVRMTLDKLEGIRGDLVRLDDNWQEWAFPQLIEALRKWTERNPPKLEEKLSQTQPDKFKKARSFHAKQETTVAARTCSYCESAEHKSLNCDKITTPSDRKQHLAQKQLCFNCTRPNHKASECRSQATCQNCRRRHHTSICTNNSEKTSNEKMMTATGKGSVVYPVVVVNVNGIQCRALLDTGAGSSYASAALLSRLQKRPLRRECRRIEMMMGSTTQVIELYKLTISSLQGDFQLDAEVTKVNRGVLLNLENPHYRSILSTYKHLDGVSMADTDEKAELPVHMILGTSEYAKIKTETPPKLGNPGEPIAELTRLGWTILSPGKEPDVSSMFLTQTSTTDYENLCKLDVLGLEDQLKDHHDNVYEEFKEQLVRSPEGWYETGLLWKANHPHLPNNKTGSLQRLKTLVRKLERQPMLNEYDRIIKDQLSEGIVEPAHHHPPKEKSSTSLTRPSYAKQQRAPRYA
ncbi:hypothetical protein QZH41_003417 [Actinostola sp. cb2023]|nr:hypothetical protein QZH41_003417 [Actinostola sp. cb2023]